MDGYMHPVLALVFCFICLGCGIFIGVFIENSHHMKILVERGHAHYDSQTGEWKWNKEKK